MTHFADAIPKSFWPHLLEDIDVTQSVRKCKTVDILMDEWLDFADTQIERHPDSKAIRDLKKTAKAIRDDHMGARIFFANVWRWSMYGQLPSTKWTE